MKIFTRTIPTMSALMLVNSPMTFAADNDMDSWYFSPMLSYIEADSSRQSDNAFGVLLGVGKPMNDHWNIELSAAIDNLDFENGSGEYKQTGLMLDGLYIFDRNAEMQTYAVVGAGMMSTDIGATDSTNPMINAGVGMMQDINETMKIRADVRYRMDMDNESIPSEDEFNDFMFNVGLVIRFGGEKAYKPTSSATSSPAATSAVPATATPAIVAASVDSDNDGVVDENDNCPDTSEGVNVDNKGCELQQSFVLQGVNFVTGSDVLTSEAKNALNDVAATLIKNSTLSVEVAGYTDDRGNADFNQQLSQKRAESVKSYLESEGVNANNMSAKGYGEDSPIADNASSDGRAKNRRVELHILN